jgi:hypothetical protein
MQRFGRRRKSAIPAIPLFLFLALPMPTPAQVPPGPVVHHFDSFRIDFDIHADGTYVETTRKTTRILDAGNVAESRRLFIDLLPPWLANKKSRFQLLVGVDIKPDGKRVDAVQKEIPSQSLGAAPPWAPATQRVLEFQDVQIGDTLEFAERFELLEAEADHGVLLDRFFPRSDAYDDVRVTVRAPHGKVTRFETGNAGTLEKGADAQGDVWTWKFANPQPIAISYGEPMDASRLVRIHITNYADVAAEMAAIHARQAPLLANNPTSSVPKLGVDASVTGDLAQQGGMPMHYSRPRSDWKEAQKSSYQELLARGKFDVLVVPFQVYANALDSGTRSLMTAELAQAQVDVTGARVADPYLVAPALGDGERRIDPDEVYRFADRLGVRQIIWGYVGHTRQGRMLLALQRQTRDGAGDLNAKTAIDASFSDSSAFTDEKPPLAVFEELLPRIAARIIDPKGWHPAPPGPGSLDEDPLPDAPITYLNRAKDPARAALAFQLLAYLAPPSAERARLRFAEKSWLALRQLSSSSPDYRVLCARAWWLLGQRPAALQTLGTPASAEERELRAARRRPTRGAAARRGGAPGRLPLVRDNGRQRHAGRLSRGQSRARRERNCRAAAARRSVAPVGAARCRGCGLVGPIRQCRPQAHPRPGFSDSRFHARGHRQRRVLRRESGPDPDGSGSCRPASRAPAPAGARAGLVLPGHRARTDRARLPGPDRGHRGDQPLARSPLPARNAGRAGSGAGAPGANRELVPGQPRL